MAVDDSSPKLPRAVITDADLASTVQEAFAHIVRAGADRVALSIGDRRETYGALDRWSNRIGRALQRTGVRPGDFVGLHARRSPEAIAACLGILKAGAAYVPFDPDYPETLLAFMASDSAPKAVIAEPDLAARATWLSLTTIISDLDASDEDDAPLDRLGHKENVAYVMYTSGSTGRPKGVLVPHRGILRLVRNADYLDFTANEVFLQLAPLAFDASTLEIWGALLNGARLAIAPPMPPSLDDIATAILAEGVTTLWLTAGLFNLMVDHRLDGLEPLKQLIIGGDVLSPAHVTKALATLPRCRIVNGYGPTENTTFTCCYTIPHESPPGASIPIGRPISGTTVTLLDVNLVPVADGEIGQLCAGGAGVAHGYLNQPALTAERFIPDADHPGRYRYLTGDLARRNPDGTFSFIGRSDRQVKISGKRVELGEIEESLRTDPEIADAAVMLREDRPGIKRLVAYLKPQGTASLDPRAIIPGLRKRLPDHMIPAELVVLDHFPLTSNGKLDRAALPAPTTTRKTLGSRSQLEDRLTEIWREVLGIEAVGRDDNFFDLGGTSLQLMAVHARLRALSDTPLTLVDLFDLPTIATLATCFERATRPMPRYRVCDETDGGAAIAVIGMAGRFPGASSVDQFWRNLCDGIDSISRFDDAALEDHFPPSVRSSEHYVKARPILDDVDQFDAGFFTMHPRETALTDPQQRVLLECAWEALEDAGYAPDHPARIGVFAGCSQNTYFLHNVCADRRFIETYTSEFQVGSYTELVGSGESFLATRISYKLGLTGPSMTVQSACSTSLLAIAQACQALRLGQAEMALAGGVSISFPQRRGYLAQEGGMVSTDGVCRPFDAAASGTVFGSGAGIVLLKRLADAERDGDTIHAVIRGVGITNDGNAKLGFTAPSAEGQAEAIMMAHADAGIDPGSISFVECHGTATPLGDPIEVAGLSKAFGSAAATRKQIVLGSVKSNVGHLDAAAGVTGFIKTTLALRHESIPGTLHFLKPNPRIAFESSPFHVSAATLSWKRGDLVRRAGVSAFGVGGTNVHLVLEEAPEVPITTPSNDAFVLPLSARTEPALLRMRERLAAHLAGNPALALADVAFTLQSGRKTFERRAAVTARSLDEAITALRKPSPTSKAQGIAPPIVFMFPGQGAQHIDMGRRLYETEPVYREQVDLCANALLPYLGLDLRTMLFGRDLGAGEPHPIVSTLLAQPALFVTEYALARLWMRWGIIPSAMVGHSVGEFVAACLGGVMTLEDALMLVAARGQLMQALPGGGMLAVRLAEADLTPLLGDDLDLAAINAPGLCVAAGPDEAIARLESVLTTRDIVHRRLHTSHAFHSAMMAPAVAGIGEKAATITLKPPAIRYVSTISGTWITDEEATSPRYWANHCRATVRFADAVRTLAEDTKPILLEVGPGRTLATLAAQTLNKGAAAAIITSLGEPGSDRDDNRTVADAVGNLWMAGAAIDWRKLRPEGSARRVSLPTYPFERQRHWIDPPKSLAQSSVPSLAMPPHVSINEALMPPVPQAPSPADQTTAVRAKITNIIETLSGESLAGTDPATSFLELGFDSLFLGQVAQQLQNSFGLKITFRQLLGDIPTLAALSDHVITHAAPEILPTAALPPAPGIALPPMPQGSGGLEALFRDQMAAMQQLFQQQMHMLGQSAVSATTAALAPSPAPPSADTTPSRIQIYKPANAAVGRALSDRQQRHLDDLVARYVAKMPGSKAATQEYRAVLADPRAASGFRAEWKEMVFPVVAERAKGSRIWDVDGNEYIDVVNGFGQTAFGHSPDFVVAAVAAQMEKGFPIGPQSPLAGEVATLFSEMTGNERVTFCNTGSEAVMAALRIARTVTGRKRVVIFGGAYHGQFDEVLVKGSSRNADRRALPVAPGIPNQSVENIVVLPYATPESLSWIKENAHDLAAIVVETVQSRHPALQPRDFLLALRDIATESGATLVFDEVVTGFRVHPGGMQALLGIKADLATYGKVVGGGMPIGILAGIPRFMDALDGGPWQYGDESIPEVAPTFFAGTFVRHPLVLAAVRAVLLHLREAGPALQQNLTRRTGALVEKLNDALEARGLSTRVETFSSFFYFSFAQETPLGSLFYAHLRLCGIHIQEGFPCFLTTAHSDADLEQFLAAFTDSLDALIEGGILEQDISLLPLATAPMTEPQREIWLSAQFGDAASCAFNESVSLRLEGELDEAALVAALNDVINRHDALRASFGITGEASSFAHRLAIDLPAMDLVDEQAFDTLIAADARAPFDLANGPLVRAKLVRFGKTRHTLIFTAHHIVCDGWSINVILDELAACYASRRAGVKATLPARLPFSRYAADRAAQSVEGTATETYWLERFKTIPAPLDLPSDRRRPAQKSFRGSTCHGQIDAALYKSVKATAAKSGATLFAMLFAAFQTLIGRLANQTDIVVAVPTAGQSLVEDKVLVGHCVNFLPLRAPFTLETPFIDHLRAAKTSVMEAMAHQDYTFGTLVRKLAVPRDPNRLPLAEVQFNLEKLGGGLPMPGLTVTVSPNPKAFSNFDLFFNVIESEQGLAIDCDYNADLFDAATIKRWIGHYRCLLAGIAADPNVLIGRLPLLDDTERARLIDRFNDTAADYPRDRLVHQLISVQALATPHAQAMSCAGEVLSYQALEARTNRLAQYLRRRIPSAGSRIAVALDRSIDLPVALLAIWKAGHSYVPLDPQHPPARLTQIIEAASVAAVICATEAMAAIAPSASTIIRLDRDADLIAREADTPIPTLAGDPLVTPAYVIFTSGSTGAPKGVEVAHGAIVNFLWSMAKQPGFAATDRVLSVTTVAFDIAALELFLPLITGGSVEMALSETVRDGFALVRLIQSSGATVLQATPSLWRMLLEAGFKAPPSFKILCGGERLPDDLAKALIDTGANVWNLYGPTETTIWSAVGRLSAGDERVTVGMPIANTNIHILDPLDNINAIGVAGEIVIGGAGLALGYLNRPDLTAAAFQILTLDGDVARRFYRTGDVGRRLADGRIEILGRQDQQIKLRGFRIELEEIEAVLRRQEGIADAAVALRADLGGTSRLVGYYVERADHSVAEASLAQRLMASLPDYMIPGVWLKLDALPLTPNGKLDRRALPDPSFGAATRQRAIVVPRTEMEQTIASVWREILHLDEIGIDDGLFSLGADSIHLFRIAASFARRGVPIEAKHLLRMPTIRELAVFAETKDKTPPSNIPSLSAFRRGARSAPEI